MQNQQTTDRLAQRTGLEPIQTQATTEQHSSEQMSQSELDEIFRQELSSIRCTIESGIADLKKSLLAEQAQPQAPTGIELVKSRIRTKYLELKSGLRKSDTKKR